MKNSSVRIVRRYIGITALALCLGTAASRAADGSWIVDIDENWGTSGNWLNGIVADGQSSTAFFTNEITGIRTVNLDTARTVGNLTFRDADNVNTPESGWVLAGSALTLTNSSATPVITVENLQNTSGLNDAKITAAITSEQGFIKKGTNTLNLTAANTFGAAIQVDEGLVGGGIAGALGNKAVIMNGGGVAIVAGAYANTNNVISTGSLVNATGGNYDNLNGPWVGSASAVMNIYSASRFTLNAGNASQLANYKGTISLSNSPSGCLFRINAGGSPNDHSAILLDTGTGAGRFACRITTANGIWKIGGIQGAGGQLCGSENSGGTMITNEVGYLNTDTTFGGVIRAYGSGREVALTKVGTGKLTLTGNNTYVGPTVVREGTLALSGGGAVASSSSITVTANGKFDVSGLDAGSWSPGAAQTLGGSGIVTGNVVMAQGTIAPGVAGIGTLSFSNNLSQAGSFVTTNLFEINSGGNDKILVAGDLSLSETIVIRAVPTGIVIPNGTYTLIKWSGNLTGDLSNLILENPAQTGTLTLGLNPTTKEIYLTVTGVATAANLTWKGNVSGDWDITTANWLDGVSPSLFSTGDKVTFDDTSTTASVNVVIDASPGNVLVNAAKDYVFDIGGGNGKITGTTSLVKSNSGALTLVTDNDYTGATTIQGGTVLVGDGNNLRGKFGSGAITNNAKVVYNRPDDLTTADTFYGTGSIVKLGVNTLTFAGMNNSSGSMTLSNGVVAINSYPALGTSTLNFSGGQLTVYPAGGPATGIANTINMVEDGTINFSASGTYALVLLGAISGTPGKVLTLNPSSTSTSRVRVYGAFTNNADLNLNAANVYLAPYNSAGSQVYNGVISGPGIIINRGGAGNTILNNAGNTFSGGMMLSQGSVGVGASSVLSGGNLISGPFGTGPIVSTIESSTVGSCTVFASGGPRTIANPITYDVGANDTTIVMGGSNDLTFSGAMSLNGNDGNITNRVIRTDNTALSTLSGVISDGGLAGSLTKTGNGVLALSGINTYTGPTLVSAGTLQLNGQIDIGGVTVTNGALGGTGTILGPVSVTTGGTLSPGAAGIGTLTVNNNLTLSGNLFIEVNRSLAQSNDVVNVSGSLNNAGTGTVTVTNLGAIALTAGNKFQLFNKALAGGGALTIVGAGVQWTNNLAIDGSIVAGAAAPTVPTTPTNITYSVSGGNLTISWPADYVGWDLQSNSVALDNSNMWFTIPASLTNNQFTVPLSTTNGKVFYRLHYTK